MAETTKKASDCPFPRATHHFREHLARLVHPEMLPDRLRQPALDFQTRIKVVRRMPDRAPSQVERCGAYDQLGHSRIDTSFLPLCLTSQSHVDEAGESQDEDEDCDEVWVKEEDENEMVMKIRVDACSPEPSSPSKYPSPPLRPI